MTIPASRFIAAGALAVAAVAAPMAIALTSAEAVSSVASPPCLSWFGNKDDGVCLAYANQPNITVGTPNVGVATGNARNGNGSGIGISTGPIGPGTSFGN
jgi:hypothetical protein